MKIHSNAKQVAKELEKLKAEAKHHRIKRAITRACYLVHSDAVRNTPVNTGRLRASIRVEIQEKGSSVVGIVGTNVKYAPYVEFGTGLYAVGGKGRQTPWIYHANEGRYHGFYYTVGQPPKLMITGAFQVHKEKIKRMLSEALNGLW